MGADSRLSLASVPALPFGDRYWILLGPLLGAIVGGTFRRDPKLAFKAGVGMWWVRWWGI